MGDDYRMYWNSEIANHTLDALTDTIRASQRGTAHNKRRGFDNDDVIRMIKLWTKATVIRLGLSQEVDWVYYRFKREPAKLVGKQKRSDVLWNAVADFQMNVENLDSKRRAQEALLNFVWDYHSRITDVDQGTDFISKVNLMISAGMDKLATEYLPRGGGHPGKV
jgi:hypothetical protein